MPEAGSALPKPSCMLASSRINQRLTSHRLVRISPPFHSHQVTRVNALHQHGKKDTYPDRLGSDRRGMAPLAPILTDSGPRCYYITPFQSRLNTYSLSTGSGTVLDFSPPLTNLILPRHVSSWHQERSFDKQKAVYRLGKNCWHPIKNPGTSDLFSRLPSSYYTEAVYTAITD